MDSKSNLIQGTEFPVHLNASTGGGTVVSIPFLNTGIPSSTGAAPYYTFQTVPAQPQYTQYHLYVSASKEELKALFKEALTEIFLALTPERAILAEGLEG